MPRRTNQFQKWIRQIEQRLAPPGAKVTESELVTDPTGTKRELDILIEHQVGPHLLRIVIECRDQKRKGDITWVECSIARKERLNLDKVVLVSKSGFTRSALAAAKDAGINTMSLDKPSYPDWADTFRKVASLGVSSTDYAPIECAVDVQDGPQSLVVDLHRDRIRSPDGTTATVFEAGKVWANGQGTAERIATASGASDDGRAQLVVEPPEYWDLLRHQGGSLRITGARFVVEKRTVHTDVRLTHADYGGSAVAYGEGELDGLRFEVTSAMRPDSTDALIHVEIGQASRPTSQAPTRQPVESPSRASRPLPADPPR